MCCHSPKAPQLSPKHQLVSKSKTPPIMIPIASPADVAPPEPLHPIHRCATATTCLVRSSASALAFGLARFHRKQVENSHYVNTLNVTSEELVMAIYLRQFAGLRGVRWKVSERRYCVNCFISAAALRCCFLNEIPMLSQSNGH